MSETNEGSKEMRIGGIDYEGSDLIPVVIERDDEDQWHLVDIQPKRLKLGDLFDSDDVRLFYKSVEAFLQDARVDAVVIKKRPRSGQFGGGAASFRMGAVVQLATQKRVEFIAPITVNNTLRETEHEDYDRLLQYQLSAFKVALAYGLRNVGK